VEYLDVILADKLHRKDVVSWGADLVARHDLKSQRGPPAKLALWCFFVRGGIQNGNDGSLRIAVRRHPTFRNSTSFLSVPPKPDTPRFVSTLGFTEDCPHPNKSFARERKTPEITMLAQACWTRGMQAKELSRAGFSHNGKVHELLIGLESLQQSEGTT